MPNTSASAPPAASAPWRRSSELRRRDAQRWRAGLAGGEVGEERKRQSHRGEVTMAEQNMQSSHIMLALAFFI